MFTRTYPACEFGREKAWLPDLLQRVVAEQAPEPPLPSQGPFDPGQQRELVLGVTRILGFNFSAGRLDSSAHPFSDGVLESHSFHFPAAALSNLANART
ncbi:hypothetical protein [Paraburkholderia humisilvae]|uniref:hypothetical protein n=1 Tax=Paraburkholderia humisilvae TaxID=627669 RepID=UPI001C2EEB3D